MSEIPRFDKEANMRLLKGLGLIGLGGATGGLMMSHGPETLENIGELFSQNVYDPAYRALHPAFSHLGANAGKYLGGGLSLAAMLATKGKIKNIIPLLGTSAAALGGGTWWDMSRRNAAADKVLWEQKLDMDKEKWRSWKDPEDPYELPSAPPDFGQTGWTPSDRPLVPLTPSSP